MIQTFTNTQNDVIRYLYNETSNQENAAIEDTLLLEGELLDFYLDCADIKLGLDQIQLWPSDKAIDTILNFSRNYRPRI